MMGFAVESRGENSRIHDAGNINRMARVYGIAGAIEKPQIQKLQGMPRAYMD
jgi:hypothetical protein